MCNMGNKLSRGVRRVNKEDRYLLVGEEILRLDGDEGSNRGCISGVRLIKRKV